MYALAKQLITEKNLVRKISILEQLVNHSQLTAKELAQLLHVSERTIFSDVQELRAELPAGWNLDANRTSGFSLTTDHFTTTNEVWIYFMEDSISIQILKALLTQKQVGVTSFSQNKGVSYATLRRHVTALNRKLRPFHLKIRLNSFHLQWQAEESMIRIFYHRLLLPFTHNNFFFDDYFIHETHYTQFLARLKRQQLAVDSEQIFGTCWFFINIIRMKAQCPIEVFTFAAEDQLFQFYQGPLQQLYASEGIQLKEMELFFAFFCFLESWNYSAFTEPLRDFLALHYADLLHDCQQMVQLLSERLHLPALKQSMLCENLALFLLKYYESKQLSDQFLLEYQELLTHSQERFPALYELVQLGMEMFGLLEQLPHSSYVVNTATLLVQETIYQVAPPQKQAYFIFQGEPAWKNLLFRELQDLLGPRITLNVSDTEFIPENEPVDLVISNYPLQTISGEKTIYISTIPTQNELQEIRQWLQPIYFM